MAGDGSNIYTETRIQTYVYVHFKGYVYVCVLKRCTYEHICIYVQSMQIVMCMHIEMI